MSKHWKQLSWRLVLTSFLSTVIALAIIPVKMYAQASTDGISPAVLAKANAGDAVSQDRVGFFYQQGMGVPQDYALAAAWFG